MIGDQPAGAVTDGLLLTVKAATSTSPGSTSAGRARVTDLTFPDEKLLLEPTTEIVVDGGGGGSVTVTVVVAVLEPAAFDAVSVAVYVPAAPYGDDAGQRRSTTCGFRGRHR
jgi:hypothetical protein